MNSLSDYLVVFVGAGIGGVLRHAANRTGLVLLGTEFPWSTLFVNITGCLMIGLIAGWFAFRAIGSEHPLRLFFITGILGGYTTFSAFSLDTALLWERGEFWLATLYVISSVAVALIGVFVGLSITRSLL